MKLVFRTSCCVAGILLLSVARAMAGIIDVNSKNLPGPHGRECIVTVENDSATQQIQDASITLGSGGLGQLSVGPIDLAPKQSKMVKTPLSSSTACDGPGIFFQIKYRQDGILNEKLLVPPAPKSQIDPILGTIFGALFGLLSGVTGVWATHRLTTSRERSNHRRDIYNAMMPKFNQFFVTWERSIFPLELRSAFQKLQLEVYIDQKMTDRYRACLATLSDQSQPLERKQLEARSLENDMRAHLERLDPDIQY